MQDNSKNKKPFVLHARGIVGAGGGPEKTIANSPRFLKPLGYDSVCAYMHPPEDPKFESFLRRAAKAGANVEPMVDRGPLDFSLIKKFVRLCRQYQVDIWHAHEYKTDLLGLIVRRYWPMKLVTTVHGYTQMTPRTRIYSALDRRILKFYDHVITVSDDLFEECKRFKVRPCRLTLIHNAIDTQDFRRKRPLGASVDPSAGFLIGAAGRLSPEKGFDLLIRSIVNLRDAGRNIRLEIAGEGPERTRLESQIAASGHANAIQLRGQVEDIHEFFESLDLFVLSSYREGLPNVLLEAMALEVPLIATRVAGIPQLVESDVSGILIDAGSVDELNASIGRMMDQPQLRIKLARAARRTIEDRFDFSKRMKKIADIYQKVLPGEPE